jgi:flagellar hook-associated protein 2
MVSQIQLGNLFQANGRQVITGGSSQLDIETLIEDLTAIKRQPAVVLEENIENNAEVTSALGEMRSLLTEFQDAANFLRNPPGVQNDADNVFEYRSADVTSNDSLPGDTYLSVTAEPGSSLASYNITVNSLATRNIKTTDTFALTDANTQAVGGGGPFNAGTLTLGPNSTAIVLDDGDSLNDVASKINAVSGESGVEAAIIRVSDGNYRLSFRTLQTGTDQNYAIQAPNPGIFNVGFDAAATTDATDASITLDGTTITRQNNSFDDVLDGLTFNLLAETPPGTELEVDVEPDTQLAKDGILNFIDAFNAFRLFASRQRERLDSGLPAEGAVLSSNNALNFSLSKINSELSTVIESFTAGDPTRLSDLGITFSDFPGDEETPFDEAELDSALASNFEGVRRVFEFDYISDDQNLAVFKRDNNLNVTEADITIDRTNNIFQATYTDNGGLTQTVDLDMSTLGGDTISLTGQEGTDLEGLQLIYASPVDKTVNLQMSQGVGDRIFNALEGLLEEDTGVVASALQRIEDQNERFEKDIERIDRQIERYRESLIQQFSALEATIASANNLLQQLDAQSRAREA